jgi:hypothetical protein
MTPIETSDLLPRIRRILLPFVNSDDDRDALLTEAFFLADPRLYAINRKGSQRMFLSNCLKTLVDYGCLRIGKHSLSQLLMTVCLDCSPEQQAEIENW